MFIWEETRWLGWHCRIWKHFISYPIVHQNLATSIIQNKHACSKIWKPKEKVCDRWVHGGGKGWVGVLLENYWGIFWTFHTFSFWYLHSGVESAPPAWWSIVGLVRFVRWTKTQANKVGALPLISTKNIKLTNTGSPFKYVCLNRRPCESPVNPDKVEANGGEEKVAKTTASSNISIIAGIL